VKFDQVIIPLYYLSNDTINAACAKQLTFGTQKHLPSVLYIYFFFISIKILSDIHEGVSTPHKLVLPTGSTNASNTPMEKAATALTISATLHQFSSQLFS
jgi:hypothetical protein